MWHSIRKATERDEERLIEKARQFAERHNIDLYDAPYPPLELDLHIAYLEDEQVPSGARLRKLWKRVVARALKHEQATGIAYGYVGYHTK